MKNTILLFWYWTEIQFSLFCYLLGISKDTSVIPEGAYCYNIDFERDEKEPREDGGHWVRYCPYFRWTRENRGMGCTYTGYYGFDLCLYDSCKICNEKKYIAI